MQFMRLKKSSSHGLAEVYAPADPRAFISRVLDLIQTMATGKTPEHVVLEVLHEVDRWEVAGPDADEFWEKLERATS
jgi:hypothetical protein